MKTILVTKLSPGQYNALVDLGYTIKFAITTPKPTTPKQVLPKMNPVPITRISKPKARKAQASYSSPIIDEPEAPKASLIANMMNLFSWKRG